MDAPRSAFHCVVVALLLTAQSVALSAQEEEDETGWSNDTELSLVMTEGNSSTETLGFKNRFRQSWQQGRYTLRLEAVRANTAEDRFVQVTGTPDEGFDVVLIEPEKTLDVERYLIENRYDREITERFFWNAGLAWDRNKDAGILNRYVAFAGVGNIWWDRTDLHFNTSYGLSYTDREEEDPDPDKDDQFAGFRFNWEYLNQWGKITTFENDWTFNTNLSDTGDWTSDMISSVAVAMNTRIALKVSLQWLYNNKPALEEIDVTATDPETGFPIELPPFEIRREKLDTIFSTSLVITF